MPAVPGTFTETPEEIAYELRAAENSIWIGSRFIIGIAAFAYASIAFAYFYLRSANSENLWRPAHVTAPTAIGAAVFALTGGAFLIVAYGLQRFRQGYTTDWEVCGWTALLLSALAIGLQIYELTRLPFFPGSSGYASCFVGWGIANMIGLLGGSYWLETLLARSLRLRRAIAADGGAASSNVPAARMFRASVEGSVYFWGFYALVGTIFWVLFYQI